MAHSRPLLSRVAEAVYWMARYIERAENVARFLDVNHNLMLDLSEGYTDQWQPIVDTTGVAPGRSLASSQWLAKPADLYHAIVACRPSGMPMRERHPRRP